MSKLDRFIGLVSDFGDWVDFVTVYVQEAHATDGWELKGNAYSIAYHKSVDDCLKAARNLKDHGLNSPLIIELITNETSLEYGAMPEALYIIENGVIVYQGLGSFAYEPDQVRKWLENKVNKRR